MRAIWFDAERNNAFPLLSLSYHILIQVNEFFFALVLIHISKTDLLSGINSIWIIGGTCWVLLAFILKYDCPPSPSSALEMYEKAVIWQDKYEA